MSVFWSLNYRTSTRVLNTLERVYLKFWKTVVRRIACQVWSGQWRWRWYWLLWNKSKDGHNEVHQYWNCNI